MRGLLLIAVAVIVSCGSDAGESGTVPVQSPPPQAVAPTRDETRPKDPKAPKEPKGHGRDDDDDDDDGARDGDCDD